MSCCGKKSSTKSVTRTQVFAKTGASPKDVNLEGMSYLIYTGTKTGSFHVFGFITNASYRVVPGQKFLVSNLDLNSATPKKIMGLMDRTNPDGTYMFEIVEPEKVEKVTEPVQELKGFVVQDFAEEFSKLEEVEFIDVFDYSVLTMSITMLNAAVRDNNYTVDELNKMIAYEQLNKNRSTAIKLLEEKKNEIAL